MGGHLIVWNPLVFLFPFFFFIIIASEAFYIWGMKTGVVIYAFVELFFLFLFLFFDVYIDF